MEEWTEDICSYFSLGVTRAQTNAQTTSLFVLWCHTYFSINESYGKPQNWISELHKYTERHLRQSEWDKNKLNLELDVTQWWLTFNV